MRTSFPAPPIARRWLAATALLLAALVLCSLPLAAQANYRIAGRVVNSVGGDPVRGATVSLLVEEDRSIVATVQSDAEGYFSIDKVSAGKYPLTASKRGYRTAYYDEHGDYNSAIVTGEGQDTEHLVFQLTPSAVLHGVITDDAGDPVENAGVLLSKRSDARSPGTHGNGIETVTTDDQGAYEFSNLAAGDYMLAVRADPWYAQHMARREPGGEQSPLDVAFPVTYYDSTIDEASATAITLAGGAREEADITVHAVPAIRLRLPTARQPARGATQISQKIFGTFAPGGDMVSRENGATEIVGLAPGHYELTQGDPPRTLDLDATANGDIDPNAGTPSLPVSGTVRMADGAAPPDLVNLGLTPIEDAHEPEMAAAHKGQFHFDGVPPGTYSIAAGAGDQTLGVVAVTVGGVATGDQITVRDKPVSVTVTLSRTQTRVEGFAKQDGKPAVGVMVLLVPRDPALYRSLVRRDQSDSDGSFSLRGVPAGHYVVVAIEDGWKLDWEKRENLERYLPGGEPVTITNQAGAFIPLAHPVEAAR